MKIVIRIVVLALFAVLIGAVGSGLTARRASACGGLAQAVDCYDAASMSYSPRDPDPGDYVFINVVIDAIVANAPGFSDTLYVDGQVVETNQVYYNGCEINVAYYYTCEGQQYPVFMTIPGRSCDGSSAGILGGLVVVGELKEAIEMLLDTYVSNPNASWSDWFFIWGKNQLIGGVGSTGNWFETWKISR